MQFEIIEFGLWGITLILMGILASYCLHIWRKDKSAYFLGLGCFISLFLVAYICSLINIYFFAFDFASMTSSYLLFNPTWLLFRSLFTVFGCAGLFPLQYALNKEVVNTKWIFIPIDASIMIMFLLNYVIPTELVYYIIPIAFTLFSIPANYFYMAKKSTGSIRVNSLLLAFGACLFLLGGLMSFPETWILFHWDPLLMRILAPGWLSAGTLLFIIGERRSRKK